MDGRPHILFITSHDLGRHLGCYGRETVTSPALDQLAAGGVLFENSFCTAPQCSPSRAALHTGRHAHAVGMHGLAHSPFSWRLHPDESHLAAILKTAGYDTALCGVQHLTSTREVAGLGYDVYRIDDPVRPAPELAEEAAAYLRATRRHERPFYLEVGFYEPHRPYDWGGATPDAQHGVGVVDYLPDDDAAREEFAALQGSILQLDNAVGEILAVLEQEGLAENTWVIFAVDHGLAMPRAKCTLYDPGIEAALIMRWPAAGLAGGRRYDYLVSHVDVVPTVLEALGLTPTQPLHGRSLWPLLQGKAYEPNDAIFAEKTFHTAYEPMRGIRTERHKLIVNLEVDTKVSIPDDIREGLIYPGMIDQLTGQRPYLELYDLAVDPGETNNLAGDPDLADVEESLRDQLLNWMRQTDDPLLKGPVASPYYSAALQALGNASGGG